jgi:DNA-binding transcriptional MerR regulator
VIIRPDEHYRIQERIRALNALGFSLGEVALEETDGGNQLRLHVVVTDRNFHRDQLVGLTGVEAEEMQARKMMNEIQELKATLSQMNNRSTPLSVAAYHWLEEIYQPIVQLLSPLINPQVDPAELYCQVLEHKWYLSEQARHDVGHEAAAQDFLQHFGKN